MTDQTHMTSHGPDVEEADRAIGDNQASPCSNNLGVSQLYDLGQTSNPRGEETGRGDFDLRLLEDAQYLPSPDYCEIAQTQGLYYDRYLGTGQAESSSYELHYQEGAQARGGEDWRSHDVPVTGSALAHHSFERRPEASSQSGGLHSDAAFSSPRESEAGDRGTFYDSQTRRKRKLMSEPTCDAAPERDSTTARKMDIGNLM